MLRNRYGRCPEQGNNADADCTMRYLLPERAEYTVGVSGCGKRAPYLVVCAQEGPGCGAGGAPNETQ